MDSVLLPSHEAAGARVGVFEGSRVALGFAEPAGELAAARAGAGLFDLSFAGAVQASGPDARRFCNGMFTQDLRSLAPGAAARSGLADDRGRLLGTIDVLCTGEQSFLLLMDGVGTGWFLERYGRYVVFDRVDLVDRSEDLALLSVQGPQRARVLSAAGLPLPEGSAVERADGLLLRARDRSGLGGVDLLVPRARAEASWGRLSAAGAVPAGILALEALRIRAGIPRWPADGGERVFLHELGLVSELCSFDKGCYLGQEVINRMDTRGAVKRRLTALSLGREVPPGASIRAGGREVGRVTSVARDGGSVIALGMLRLGVRAPMTAGDGVPLSLRDPG